MESESNQSKTKMIETVFSIDIKGARETVWHILWGAESFKDWANIIDEGTFLKGELVQGQLIEFISAVNGYGVTSLVAELIPYEYVMFHHGADTKDMGQALRDQEWTGGKESYLLSERAGITTLTVKTDIPSDLLELFEVRLPLALKRIKTLSEKRLDTRQMVNFNIEVTDFLDKQMHPMRVEIEALRDLILSAEPNLMEGIKWNGPNYSLNGEDRITMRLNPPKQIQVVFHRGAKVKNQPDNRLIDGNYPFLTWKENDRTIATFKGLDDILQFSEMFHEVVTKWVKATT